MGFRPTWPKVRSATSSLGSRMATVHGTARSKETTQPSSWTTGSEVLETRSTRSQRAWRTRLQRRYTARSRCAATCAFSCAKPNMSRCSSRHTQPACRRPGRSDARPMRRLRRRQSVRDSYDAIIVGAGHNGLTLGAYLARSGLEVLVLERRHEEGCLLYTSPS